MPNSRHTSLIDSPSSSLTTNRRRSSITEHSFHGIDTSPGNRESVTYVSGTFRFLCLGPLKGLGIENQVLLPAVGPLWNELSTGPVRPAVIHGVAAQNQVLRGAVGLLQFLSGDSHP